VSPTERQEWLALMAEGRRDGWTDIVKGDMFLPQWHSGAARGANYYIWLHFPTLAPWGEQGGLPGRSTSKLPSGLSHGIEDSTGHRGQAAYDELAPRAAPIERGVHRTADGTRNSPERGIGCQNGTRRQE